MPYYNIFPPRSKNTTENEDKQGQTMPTQAAPDLFGPFNSNIGSRSRIVPKRRSRVAAIEEDIEPVALYDRPLARYAVHIV